MRRILTVYSGGGKLETVLSEPDTDARIESAYRQVCDRIMEIGFVVYGLGSPFLDNRCVFINDPDLFVSIAIVPG